MTDIFNAPAINSHTYVLTTPDLYSRFPNLYVPADFVRLNMDWTSIMFSIRSDITKHIQTTGKDFFLLYHFYSFLHFSHSFFTHFCHLKSSYFTLFTLFNPFLPSFIFLVPFIIESNPVKLPDRNPPAPVISETGRDF
jgi:hypothetical protein